ncbi:MAG: acetyl-CoA carboxylase biotin carboxyl carrier protein [Pyrinomonadaceae bacterium]
MSSQDRPEPTGAASAPAREPEARAAEPRGESPTPANTASGDERAGAQQGRRHARRRHQRSTSGGGGGERETPTAQGRPPERELNLDELRELSELINEQGFTEFEIEREGFRLRISKQLLAAPVSQAHAGMQPFVPPTITPGTTPATTTPVESNEGTHTPSGEAAPIQPSAGAELHKITSPIVGTFYRSASPTAEPFVQVGSSVGPDSVVCIIEAMKLMNEILAETSGTVVEVYVENGQPVEFGQALFGIRKQ